MEIKSAKSVENKRVKIIPIKKPKYTIFLATNLPSVSYKTWRHSCWPISTRYSGVSKTVSAGVKKRKKYESRFCIEDIDQSALSIVDWWKGLT